MKPELLIIANRTLHSAPRVIREIEALKHDFNITVVGITAPSDNQVSFINIRTLNSSILYRIVRRVFGYFCSAAFIKEKMSVRRKSLIKLITQTKAKYVILHETNFLPSLIKIKTKLGLKIIFNAHEYHPGEFEDSKEWVKHWQPYYIQIYQTFLKNVDLFINVSDTIADKCEKEFGKKSLVIPNAALYKRIAPKDNRNNKTIRMIYHGVCMESRKIEEMLELAVLLGNGYSFDFMFPNGNEDYSKRIIKTAKSIKNVNIIPPVEFDQIIEDTNKYDLGIFILPIINFNAIGALPNKFFEYIQARLCVVISPNMEMKKITEKYNLGIVSDNFTAKSLAEKILKLTKEEIHNYKINADKAALYLNAEHYNGIYLNAVKDLK